MDAREAIVNLFKAVPDSILISELASRLGDRQKGSRNGGVVAPRRRASRERLTNATKKEIRSLRAKGFSHTAISKKIGCSVATVYRYSS